MPAFLDKGALFASTSANNARAPLPHQWPYRADIDGLRAVAVLSVIGFHARPDLVPGGFIGVDVFFVISGFLISSLLLDSAQHRTFNVLDFYSRRIRRILPALLLVLTAVLVAGWILMLPHEFSDLGKLIVSAVLFVPNFQLWSQAGYFEGNPATRPLLHLWSLGVEEQFYLIWPWLVSAFWKKGLPWVIAALAAISFLAGIVFLPHYPSAVFYLPLTRLWELLAGGFLAWHERRHIRSEFGAIKEIPRFARELLSLTGLLLIAACCVQMKSNVPFPGWRAAPIVIGTMMTIAAGASASMNRIFLSQPAIVWFGLISYPLYLWHWPILVFLHIWKNGEPPNHLKDAAVLAAVLLSWFTYRFLEKPVRSLKVDSRRKGAVWGLLAGLIILGIGGTAIIAFDGLPIRFPKNIRSFLVFEYGNTNSWRYDCFLQSSQPPSAWSRPACVQPQTDPTQPLIVIWGDSHAADLRPGLDALQKQWKFRIGQMTAAGCPPFVGLDVADRPYCRAENDQFLNEIRKGKPDIVLLSGWWTRYGTQGVAATIARLKEAHIKKVIVLGPAPDWSEYLPDLLVKIAMRNGGRLPVSLGPDYWSQTPEAPLKSLAAKQDSVYISFADAMCPAGQCVTMTGYAPRQVTFLDAGHLRDPGSRLLIQRISNQLFSGLGISKR